MLIADYASVDENSPPDFHAFKAFGGSAVIVRGAFTFKGLSFGDPCIARDRDAIAAAGLKFGAYLIHGWNVDPIAQVKQFVHTVGPYRAGDLPVWLDAESATDLSAFGLSPAAGLDRLEVTYRELLGTYPIVGVYTSLRWWDEILHGVDSMFLDAAPLWLKIPYPYKTGQPAHPEARGVMTALPKPWTEPHSPGAWMKQFQGDAKKVPGFSNQVDLSEWLTYDARIPDERTPWVIERLRCHAILARAPNIGLGVETFQRAMSLDPDQKIGPATFSALCGG